MSQEIKVNTVNGSFLIPCYQFEADVLKSGLAYNTTSFNVQVATVNGSFYNYSSPNITSGVAPTGNNQIGFYQLNPSAYIAKLQLHSSVYSSLSVASGETIGMVAVTASGFAPVSASLKFDLPIQSGVQAAIEANHLDHLLGAAYDATSKVGNSSSLLNTLIDSASTRFSVTALELGPTGSGGGGGSGDWTVNEKSQIRYVLGIDGSQTTPAASPSGLFRANIVQVNGVVASGTGTVSVSATEVRAALGMSSANLDTQLADLPTVSEFNARTLPSGSYLDQSGVRTAVGMSSGNLDTQLADLPTVAEFEARTLPSGQYALQTEVSGILKSGEQRRIARSGKTDVVYTETRE